jgi:hypothetical protein
MQNRRKLSIQQIVVRAIFLLGAVVLIDYVFPQHEAFRYEYEVGKPWRYGELTTNSDFPVYYPDTIIQRMEDSLRREVAPIFVADTAQVTDVMHRMNREHAVLSDVAFRNLSIRLMGYYANGIISNPDKNRLMADGFAVARVASAKNTLHVVAADSIWSEKQVYEALADDPLYAADYRQIASLQDYVEANLRLDSSAMNREYRELRKTISTSYRVI